MDIIILDQQEMFEDHLPAGLATWPTPAAPPIPAAKSRTVWAESISTKLKLPGPRI